MKEGDTLRIGASSRLYRLHWIPISHAYDLENPFVSESDMAVEAEIGQEDDALPEEEEKEMTPISGYHLSAAVHIPPIIVTAQISESDY